MLAGEQYADIGAEYGQKKEAIRSAVRAAIASGALERPTAARPVITGVGAADTTVDPEIAWEQACRAWEATARIAEAKAVQTIAFERGPICIAAVADIHAGSTGVDYPRVDRELGVIRDTDGIYAILNGDIVDNMIIGKLLATRMGEGISIPSEWAIARRVLGMVASKTLVVVGGNHDAWTHRLAGIDYFRETVAEIAPSALYDSDDCEWDLSVGSSSWRCRARHKWLGSSIYNPTHGMERASKFDRPVDIAFGAHTHVSGLIRMYNNHGRTGYAVQCGAYKVHDSYARVSGFARPNGSTAVGLILHDDGNVAMYDDIATAARHMNALGNLGWV